MWKLTEGSCFTLEFLFLTKEANSKATEGKKIGVCAEAHERCGLD